MAESTTLSSLLEKYELSEGMCDYKISDAHLGDISRSHCSRWRELPSRLEMEEMVAKDINKDPALVNKKMNDLSFSHSGRRPKALEPLTELSLALSSRSNVWRMQRVCVSS